MHPFYWVALAILTIHAAPSQEVSAIDAAGDSRAVVSQVEPPAPPESGDASDKAPPLQSLRPKLAASHVIGFENFGDPGETHFFPDPTRRSGVMVFYDDALGTTIGVVMTENWGSDDFAQGWQQYRRFWQVKEWCLNVTSFAWSPDGRYLFVGTSDIYGTGDLYQLDMNTRRWAVLFPRERDESLDGHCWSSEIVKVDQDAVRFHVRDYCNEDEVFVRRTLPFLTEEDFPAMDATEP